MLGTVALATGCSIKNVNEAVSFVTHNKQFKFNDLKTFKNFTCTIRIQKK